MITLGEWDWTLRRNRRADLLSSDQLSTDQQGPRKRQRVEELRESVSDADWDEFEQDLRNFDVQHVQGRGKLAFAFVEGPLIRALRSGDWFVLATFARSCFSPDVEKGPHRRNQPCKCRDFGMHLESSPKRYFLYHTYRTGIIGTYSPPPQFPALCLHESCH